MVTQRREPVVQALQTELRHLRDLTGRDAAAAATAAPRAAVPDLQTPLTELSVDVPEFVRRLRHTLRVADVTLRAYQQQVLPAARAAPDHGKALADRLQDASLQTQRYAPLAAALADAAVRLDDYHATPAAIMDAMAARYGLDHFVAAHDEEGMPQSVTLCGRVFVLDAELGADGRAQRVSLSYATEGAASAAMEQCLLRGLQAVGTFRPPARASTPPRPWTPAQLMRNVGILARYDRLSHAAPLDVYRVLSMLERDLALIHTLERQHGAALDRVVREGHGLPMAYDGTLTLDLLFLAHPMHLARLQGAPNADCAAPGAPAYRIAFDVVTGPVAPFLTMPKLAGAVVVAAAAATDAATDAAAADVADVPRRPLAILGGPNTLHLLDAVGAPDRHVTRAPLSLALVLHPDHGQPPLVVPVAMLRALVDRIRGCRAAVADPESDGADGETHPATATEDGTFWCFERALATASPASKPTAAPAGGFLAMLSPRLVSAGTAAYCPVPAPPASGADASTAGWLGFRVDPSVVAAMAQCPAVAVSRIPLGSGGLHAVRPVLDVLRRAALFEALLASTRLAGDRPAAARGHGPGVGDDDDDDADAEASPHEAPRERVRWLELSHVVPCEALAWRMLVPTAPYVAFVWIGIRDTLEPALQLCHTVPAAGTPTAAHRLAWGDAARAQAILAATWSIPLAVQALPTAMSRFGGAAAPAMDLKAFLLRGKVLQLYRDLTRHLKYMDAADRAYYRDWIRSDFEHYRHEPNRDKIESLLKQGQIQLRTLSKTVVLSKARYRDD
ncbi:hypothetical protein CXG81DRAFT_23920 [Caulochytrium protostelioides]|uniref:LYR motif-containing protein 2 n=1 Tax=Caulochytrium protostelioides TaxID=1555241 RepID=A0A4P9XD33_9FUNG|nr:hypothetical protein CXG81DRAFT_23920 [Caulochytrium protostelioides]|eukprot:RKP03394.1 hypothetical protein CXG81DRAFT_23920 [Caulochytrium protostelioides]